MPYLAYEDKVANKRFLEKADWSCRERIVIRRDLPAQLDVLPFIMYNLLKHLLPREHPFLQIKELE